MKKHLRIRITVLVLMLLQASTCAASGLLFGVTATGTSANASITLCLDASGPISCQVYNVTATNLSITSTLSHLYPNAGIKSNTPEFTLTGCTPMANGYCQFAVNKTTPAAVTLVPASNVRTPRFAYIGSFSGPTFTQCSIDATTGALSACANSSQFSVASGIAINAAGTRGYVATVSNVQLCQINASTGAFESCATTFMGEAITVSLNAAGTYAYLGTTTDTVMKCSVNQQTGALSSCSSTGSGFISSINVVFNATGTRAYVGNNATATVGLCSVNATTGDFTSCTTTTGGGGFSQPTGIALNSAGNIAYVAAYNNAILDECNVDTNTGAFSGCVPTGSNFNDPSNILLNAAGTFAYVANNFSSVTLCSVNATTGALTHCATTGSGFATGTFALAILYTNNNG